MALTEEEKAELVIGIAEDLKMFADTYEDGKPSEADVIAWRGGYIAGYNRSSLLNSAKDQAGSDE